VHIKRHRAPPGTIRNPAKMPCGYRARQAAEQIGLGASGRRSEGRPGVPASMSFVSSLAEGQPSALLKKTTDIPYPVERWLDFHYRADFVTERLGTRIFAKRSWLHVTLLQWIKISLSRGIQPCGIHSKIYLIIWARRNPEKTAYVTSPTMPLVGNQIANFKVLDFVQEGSTTYHRHMRFLTMRH